MRSWTAIAMGLSLFVGSGCVIEDELDELDPVELEEAALAAGVVPDAADDAVCDALSRRAQTCPGDETVAPGCAARFACSRELWREEIVEEVYDCVETQPCNVGDPAMACLTEIGVELEPTTHQLDAERAIRSLDGQCDDMITMAPGQTDEVYEIIAQCVDAEDSCDGIGTCVVLSLETLVADVCGQVDTI